MSMSCRLKRVPTLGGGGNSGGGGGGEQLAAGGGGAEGRDCSVVSSSNDESDNVFGSRCNTVSNDMFLLAGCTGAQSASLPSPLPPWPAAGEHGGGVDIV
jgi:hypothetical protein